MAYDKYWLVRCVIPRVGGVPADAFMNTWHFEFDSAIHSDAAAWAYTAGLMQGVYDILDDVMSDEITDTPATITAYDLATAEPRPPIFTESIDLNPASGACLPTEVALCLSYKGAYELGVNNASRRGRIYVGPIITSALAAGSGVSAPSTGAQTVLVDAGTYVVGASDETFSWMVYSPTLRDAVSLPFACTPVIGGWVDNAWDTQRRRGEAPSLRTTW